VKPKKVETAPVKPDKVEIAPVKPNIVETTPVKPNIAETTPTVDFMRKKLNLRLRDSMLGEDETIPFFCACLGCGRPTRLRTGGTGNRKWICAGFCQRQPRYATNRECYRCKRAWEATAAATLPD